MGCASSNYQKQNLQITPLAKKKKQDVISTNSLQPAPIIPRNIVKPVRKPFNPDAALVSSIIIQKWYRRYKARLELKRHCAWKVFQEIEYSAEHDQINLYNFFNEMVANVENNTNHANKVFVNMLTKAQSSGNLMAGESMTEISNMDVDSTYKGPHVELPITLEKTKDLLEYFKAKKKQILHPKYVKLILLEAFSRMKNLPNVIEMNLNICKQVTVVGDIHGKFNDFLTIFNKNGLPSAENPYIFNGDFVDRGKKSLEIFLLLCCFHILYPDHVILNRGNHEDYIMNSRYGFTKEVTNKYKGEAGHIMDLCSKVFSWLPLATLIGEKIFVCHGGISDRTDLERLKTVRRHQFSSVLKPTHVSLDDHEPPSFEVLQEWEQIIDLLWSDPQCQPGKIFNKYRGGGCCFGPDVTKMILDKYNWDLLIRSHECKFEGYEYTHDDKVLTIFSVSSYYASSSNLGAYVKIDINLKPRIIQFDAPKTRMTVRVGVNEDEATQDLKRKIYSQREELLTEFKKLDETSRGSIHVQEWTNVMEKVLQMKLPWYLLRPKLVVQDENGFILYETLFEGYRIDSTLPQLNGLSETIYRNKDALYTVFRIIDKDCSGFISIEEFEEACRVLNKFDDRDDDTPNSSISDLAKALDINKDGKIDFNEFLEAFRLVNNSIGEKSTVAASVTS